ncbi:MAG: hypothetical protein IT158_27795 [Bryobacterales bacterium]|nr:hypothetical protein [Bryobacterales bacterium]
MTIQSAISAALCAFLAASPAAYAQQPPSAAPRTETLTLVVLQGQNATHSVTTKTATQTVVEVRDQTNRTVPNARVVFQLPASGPGGSFPGGRTTMTAVTNFQGQAATSGFVPNDVLGKFELKVTASLRDKTASIVIPQSNLTKVEEPVAKKSRKTLWILLAGGAAAGAVAGVVLATRKSPGAAGGPPPVVAVPGTITVGGPR